MMYYFLKQQIQTGDLIEWSSDSLVGGLIRAFTGRDVNHTSLALRLDFAGLHDRRFVLEALGHGITLNLLSRRLEHYKGRVYWSPLKPCYDYARGAIAGWALQQVSKPYDYASLFKQMLGRVSADMKKLFCSEYAYLAYKNVGLIESDRSAPRPGEFDQFGLHGPRQQIA